MGMEEKNDSIILKVVSGECNYKATDRELLALAIFLERLRYHLKILSLKIFTGNQVIKPFFRSPSKAEGKQNGWKSRMALVSSQ